MSLWGKTKEEEAAAQAAAQAQATPQPQAQVPQPPPPESTPQPTPAPEDEGVEAPEEMIEGDPEEEGLRRIFVEFNASLTSFEDDDLGIIYGRLLQEMIDRQLEASETTGSLVRRLRRMEALLAHSVAGGNHTISISDGRFRCACGGLVIPLAVPAEDKFGWDNRATRPKGQEEEDEGDEDGGE